MLELSQTSLGTDQETSHCRDSECKSDICVWSERFAECYVVFAF